MYYSKSMLGFCHPDFHNPMPADAREVPDNEYTALLEGQAAGFEIVSNSDGYPILAEPPGPTVEQQTAARCAEILADLAALDAASARPLRAILVGSATDADRARLTELDEQAAALRAELVALRG